MRAAQKSNNSPEVDDHAERILRVSLRDLKVTPLTEGMLAHAAAHDTWERENAEYMQVFREVLEMKEGRGIGPALTRLLRRNDLLNETHAVLKKAGLRLSYIGGRE